MSMPGGVLAPNLTAAPPYPAAVSITGSHWHSPLARDGHVPLVRPAIQIGRMDSNDITLTDPLVSRHHAAIRWTPGGYEIEDLGSANGTYVQGQRVQGHLSLAPGHTIRIGNTDLHFDILPPSQQLAGAAARVSPISPASPSPLASPLGMGMAPPRAVSGMATAAAQHPYYAMVPPRENAFARMLKTQARKRYWRVFLLGILAYFVVAQVLTSTDNLHLVPLEMLIASALVPVVFVIFCWEQSAFVDMPPAVVGLTFLSGAILGLTIAAVVEPLLVPSGATSAGIDLSTAILIGVIEETAKVISVAWFLRDRRLRGELDGLILGAAAGMGFAALETAGYGFASFLLGFVDTAQQGGNTMAILFNGGVRAMNHELLVRMALAIFGHGVWTAIVCAVIWRERGQATFRVTPSVIAAFLIAVGLHALWDWSPLTSTLTNTTDTTTVLVTVFGWFLFIGLLGLLILRFLLRESLDRAKLGPMAPPPPSFIPALLTGKFARHPQQPPSWQANVPLAPGSAMPAASPPPQQPQPQAPPVWPIAQGPGAAPGKMAYCPRCGISYLPGTRICARCGGVLT